MSTDPEAGPAAGHPAMHPGRALLAAALWPRASGFWWVALRKQWRSFIALAVLSPLLYLASLGFGLGALAGDVAGMSYAAFVAPGLMAATAMQTSVSDGAWPVMGAIRWSREYHAQLATPLRVVDVLTGHAVVLGIRVAVSAAAFAAVLVALGLMDSAAGLLSVPAAVLTGLAFACPTMAFTAAARTDQSLAVLFRFVVIPLFLISGTFFPVDQLPLVLRAVVWCFPLWHGVELCRDATSAMLSLPWWAVAGHVCYLLLWIVGGWFVARAVFIRRLS